MSQNSHAELAQFASLELDERNVEATLAVAYEQRTANMIAYADLLVEMKEEKIAKQVLATIHERLYP